MARSTRLFQVLALGAAASLTFAACGGGETAAPEESPTDSPDAEAPAATSDEALHIGTLLPETGSLAFLGPPECAGVTLAVQEINDAGGVLGQEVEQTDSDSGDTSTNIAQQSVDTLLNAGVQAIIGAASSSVSFSVIDKITGAGVVMVSPANTSPDFTTYDDGGLYWRTAPSDVLQGRVLGDTVLADGNANVAILALQDAYGEGLAENAETSITDGGGTVTTTVFYDPKAANYAAEVTEVKDTNPDAIILIGFDETKKMIPEMIKQGVGPADKPIYFVDGNLADYSADFEPGTLVGVKGTLPGAEVTEEFKQRLIDAYGDLTVFAYGPESYDAAIVIALAAEAAGSVEGTAIAENMQAVTTEGEKCTTFADCVELIRAGEDIDYDGVSGPIEFDENGDPTEAFIGIYEYEENNNYVPIEFRPGQL